MNRIPSRFSSASKQNGSMLLEGLIAILLFSMGILAIVGMQGSAIRASNDAKYRSEANMIANKLIGQMRTSNTAALQANFQGGGGTDGAAYTAWLTSVQALPNSDVYPPVVAIGGSNLVTITVNWLSPGEPVTALHNYTVVAQIQ